MTQPEPPIVSTSFGERRGLLLLAGGLVAVVVVIAAFLGWSLQRGERRSVDPRLLVPDVSDLSSLDGGPWSGGPASTFEQGSRAGVRYLAADQGRDVTFLVRRTSGVLAARWESRRDGFLKRRADELDADPERIELERTYTADSSEAACVVRSVDSCNLWIYQARFGQYLVTGVLEDIKNTIPEAEFRRLIDVVGRRVGSRLA